MKYSNYDIGGTVVKEDDRYLVKDNTELKNLIVSSTLLHPNKSTTGHSHSGQEEVHHFVYGQGTMILGESTFFVKPGDVVLVPDGMFHRVHNDTNHDLYFVCVFQGQRNH